ncbi:MAG TPA: GatB/YqeY domain-containing protein [Alphaproteobacteria bacterium]|nr:GatB/YqeY domain-containing protein [Alphaproteobacteria bacterium]
MSKREEFTTALKEALKNKDQVAMSTIRLITAAIKDRDIAARGTGNLDGIGEAEILSLLQSMVKQRQESSKTYSDAGRPELAERELAEIKVIERFLPAQMGEDEVSAAIDSIIAEVGASDIKDMGKVMNELKAKYAGQMDMAKVGGLVKAKLAA